MIALAALAGSALGIVAGPRVSEGVDQRRSETMVGLSDIDTDEHIDRIIVGLGHRTLTFLLKSGSMRW